MSGEFWNNLKAYLPSIQVFVQTLVSNSIVLSVIAWLAKIWADRRIQILKGEQTEKLEELRGTQAQKIEEVKGFQTAQIESLKGDVANLGRDFQANLDKRMLVFQIHFDIEFKSYQDIWAKCDEAADLAAMTLSCVQRDPVDEAAQEEEKLNSIRRYDTCREALAEVRKKRPFVTKEISDMSRTVTVQCVNITNQYRAEYPFMARNSEFERKELIYEIKEKVDEMVLNLDHLGDLIANRISSLYTANA